MNEMDKPGRERVRMKCSNDKVVIDGVKGFSSVKKENVIIFERVGGVVNGGVKKFIKGVDVVSTNPALNKTFLRRVKDVLASWSDRGSDGGSKDAIASVGDTNGTDVFRKKCT